MSCERGRLDRWPRTALIALVYVAIGLLTARLAGGASSTAARAAWRSAAWLLSFFVFIAQLLAERPLGTPIRGAMHSALAVALGVFALALAGPVRAHWGAEDQLRALSAVVIWPVLTGAPAFAAGFVISTLLRRVPGARPPRRP